MQKNTQFLLVLCALVITFWCILCWRIEAQGQVNIHHSENPESCTYTALFPAGRSAAVTACLTRELASSETLLKNKTRLKDGAVFRICLKPGSLFISARKAENNRAALAHIHRLYEAIPQAFR
jgi:hypothetical protein